MGQNVVINSKVDVGDVLVIDTDRSFTGQEGHTITPDGSGAAVPGVLADRLFALGIGIDHVHVLQNVITLRRPGGWTEELADRAQDVTENFLLFYDEEE